MRLSSILLLVICVGCREHHQKVEIFKTKDFIIVDTTIKADKFLSIDGYNSEYPIYYIGMPSDTIKIGKRYWRGRTKWVNDNKTFISRTYSKKTLSIFVDTSIKTNSPIEYLSDDPNIAKDSTENYHSFIFTMKNISDSTIYIGRSFSLFFIRREVKDKDGNWIKIEPYPLEGCGTGQPLINLRPQELLISKLKRYTGSFVTDFRLVFGYDNNIVYSNIFRDSIDERCIKPAAMNN